MAKKIVLSLGLVALAFAVAFPATASVSRTITGRITAFTATSLSVQDREILTVALNDRTVYTKLLTQKPWEEDTRLGARALAVGRYVAVHVSGEGPLVADWVQVATDMPPVTVTTSLGVSQPTAPAASKKEKGAASDLLTARQVTSLIATAKTPADHLKLQKHYLALAAKYEAEADEHVADAQAYRKNPTFLESKTPGGPGTAAHCERFAELDRQAAKEARDLASAHEHMASAK
jgi:hypothetical protein